MTIECVKGAWSNVETDLLVLARTEGNELSTQLQELDDALEGRLGRVMKEEGFEGKEDTSFLLHTDGDAVLAKRVLVLGLGEASRITAESLRVASAAAVSRARSLKVENLTLSFLNDALMDTSEAASAIAHGALLATYQFTAYKEAEKESLKLIVLPVSDGRQVRRAMQGADLGEAIARGVMMARDLVNTPGQEMYPEVLMKKAKEITTGVGTLRVKVYNQEQLEKMGAHAMLSINQGSEHEPYLVHLTYKPKKKAKKKICLVGKAVTFDSGGLSIKPSNAMETMKVDMAGSAAVLGTFAVIDEIAPNVEVHGIFAAVENMPSGKAIRPGDVVRAMNKKTIEILNTDAEGRVTLADALSYAVKQKPDHIVDLATLTGACVVALGEEISGLMTDDDALAEKLHTAAKEGGEKLWSMPLEKNYKKLLKSDIADIKNIGSRWGGALTAGLFLQEFVEDVSWAHMDIAGPAYNERPVSAYQPKGATGHAVATLINFLRAF